MGGILQAKLAIVLGCAAVIGAGWTITLERIHYERQNEIEDVVRHNGNLAIAFEEQTLSAIRAADQALIFLRNQYQNHGQVAELGELFQAGLLDSALIPNYLVTDARGRVLGKDAAPTALDVSDRDFYAFHRGQSSDRLFISKPFTGRVTGKTVISLSRRIRSADGRFAGVVSVGLDALYFLKTYQSLDLGPRGLIQLVGLDGVARARRVGDAVSFGEDMRDSRLLERAAAAPAGSFVSRGNWSEGVPRYQSYRVLRDYPLIIAVGTAEDDALAGFSARSRHYYAGAALATVLMLVLAAGLALAQARRERAEADKGAMEERYRETFDEAGVGIAHVDAAGRFLKVNRKLCDLLGYDENELLARSWSELTHPEHVNAAADVMRRMLAEPGLRVPEFEKRCRRKDGRELWGSVSVALVRDREGRPQYFVTFVQDVTARKQAEAQLIEQLDELRRFQKVTVNRELRMIELEAEIRALRGKEAA